MPDEPLATLRSSTAIQLGLRVIAAAYSNSLNRLVLLTADPNELVVLDPETGQRRSLALPSAAAAIAVHPDGRSAAIAHDHALGIVQLEPLQLLDTLPNSLNNASVAFGANGYVYATDRAPGKPFSAIQIQTHKETLGSSALGENYQPRLHPSGDRLYVPSRGVSPGNLIRYDLTAGLVGESHESPYWGNYPICGDAWFTHDGERVVTSCGPAFRTSNDPLVDMRYAGALESQLMVRHMDDSAPAGLIATVHYETLQRQGERQTLRLFDNAFLNLRQTLKFPQFDVLGKSYAADGCNVFFSADGKRLYALVQVEATAMLRRGFALMRYDIRAQSADLLPIEPGPVDPPFPRAVTRTPEGTVLDFDPVDAEYSRTLDRMLVLRSHPNQLLLLNAAGERVIIDLALPPLSVSLHRDGVRAVVGHDGWVSLIDLNARRVEKIVHAAAVAGDIVFTGNSAFVLPGSGQFLSARWVDLDSGLDSDTGNTMLYEGSHAKLHRDGDRLYGTSTRLNPSSMLRIDLGVGFSKVSQFSNGVSPCNEIWLSEDGAQLFTGCGDVMTITQATDQDLRRRATLDVSPMYVDHSAAAGLLAVSYSETVMGTSSATRGVLQLRDASNLSVRGELALPSVTLDSAQYPAYARFAFFDAAGTSVNMLLRPAVPFGTKLYASVMLSVRTSDVPVQ